MADVDHPSAISFEVPVTEALSMEIAEAINEECQAERDLERHRRALLDYCRLLSEEENREELRS